MRIINYIYCLKQKKSIKTSAIIWDYKKFGEKNLSVLIEMGKGGRKIREKLKTKFVSINKEAWVCMLLSRHS